MNFTSGRLSFSDITGNPAEQKTLFKWHADLEHDVWSSL